MKIKEKSNNLLLVEGNDDMHVVLALCEKFKINENFSIIDCKGIDNLFIQLPVRFKQSEIQTIGIIIDADSEINSRWQKIKTLLKDIDFEIPDEIPVDGLILKSDDKVTIGIWLMPNNNNNGMIEDFITFLIPKEDKLKKIVDQTLTQIEKDKLNQYALIHKSKATIHSWLALQNDPGTPMGLSITKKYLSTDDQNCLIFVNWIRNLFI